MPIGYHVNRDGPATIARAIADAGDVLTSRGIAPAAQIFICGPRTFDSRVTDADIAELTVIARDVDIVVHGTFTDAPWRHHPDAIKNIIYEMNTVARFGGKGVIVHLGRDANRSLERVLSKIDAGVVADAPPLWLEINAVRPGDDTFETPAKLHALFNRVAALKLRMRVGLCIDTAHLHSCGVTLTTAAEAERWLAGLEGLPAADIMMHLNDSASAAGSGIDRHAALGRGNIWGYDQSGMRTILEWIDERDMLTILERAVDDLADDLDIIDSGRYFPLD